MSIDVVGLNSFKETCKSRLIGNINISVFRTDDNITSFSIKTDNDDVLNVCDIIEDTLKLY